MNFIVHRRLIKYLWEFTQFAMATCTYFVHASIGCPFINYRTFSLWSSAVQWIVYMNRSSVVGKTSSFQAFFAFADAIATYEPIWMVKCTDSSISWSNKAFFITIPVQQTEPNDKIMLCIRIRIRIRRVMQSACTLCSWVMVICALVCLAFTRARTHTHIRGN